VANASYRSCLKKIVRGRELMHTGLHSEGTTDAVVLAGLEEEKDCQSM
jgi:hypothetical protein